MPVIVANVVWPASGGAASNKTRGATSSKSRKRGMAKPPQFGPTLARQVAREQADIAGKRLRHDDTLPGRLAARVDVERVVLLHRIGLSRERDDHVAGREDRDEAVRLPDRPFLDPGAARVERRDHGAHALLQIRGRSA